MTVLHLILSMLINFSYSSLLYSPIISTKSGKIIGKYINGNISSYYSFQGIPYAEPPVGQLRFRTTQPIKPWDGVLNATQTRNICPQRVKNKNVKMGEDCLFLNIYVPSNSIEKFPVFFWIHGGELTSGSGNPDIYGPDFLIKENVAVVTVNYRLGALGFLCPKTEDAPGNMGIKDAIEAIKWVKTNIKYFGCDPNKITVGGESAGSIMVHYLLLSNVTNGLFEKAIMTSGSLLGYRFLTNSSIENAYWLGRELGINTKNAYELVNNLRLVNESKIVEATFKIQESNQNKGAIIFRPFEPCIEESFNREPIITDYPMNIIKSGKYKSIPIIAGFNTDEGTKILSEISGSEVLNEINEDFTKVVPPNLELLNAEKSRVAADIKTFYFGNESLSYNTLPQYIKLTGDEMFLHPIDYWMRLHAFQNSIAYYYEFNCNGSFNDIKLTSCGHGYDLSYLWLFDSTNNIELEENDASNVVRERFVKLWTNFIKYGDPTPKKTDLLYIKWEEINENQLKYLKFANFMELGESPYRNRTKFWEDLYDYN